MDLHLVGRAVYVDLLVFSLLDGVLSILLVRPKVEEYQSRWALPHRLLLGSTTIERAGLDALRELTGIADSPIAHIGGKSDRGSDIPSSVYIALSVVRGSDVTLTPGKDIHEARWFVINGPGSDVMAQLPELALAHGSYVMEGLFWLRNQFHDISMLARMLPELFSLSDLQSAAEAVAGRPIDKRNFRTQALHSDWLEETDQMSKGAHRPAKMYRLRSA